MSSSDKQVHLEMIQNVINRLSQNSFLLKGWSIVLVSALLALTAKDSNAFFIYISYFPAISFWGLDGYFLHQERMFRKLYDHVRKLEETTISFSMDTSIIKDQVASWLSVTFSKTIIVFHGSIFITILLIVLFFTINV